MKQGTKFEKLTEEILTHLTSLGIFTSVEHDVMLEGPDGKRQIDILLKGKIGNIELTNIVECKDYNKNISITHIDALHSKMIDIKATQAILVARKGFSSGAKRKARRLGIVLCTSHEAKSEKWPFTQRMPFIIEEHTCDNIRCAAQFVLPQKQSEINQSDLHNRVLLNLVCDFWKTKDITFSNNTTYYEFMPDDTSSLHTFTEAGDRLDISGIKIGLKFRRKYYFGYLDELYSTIGMRMIEGACTDVVFRSEEFMDYRTQLPEYKNFEDIPKVSQCMHATTKVIDFFQIDFQNKLHKKEQFRSVKFNERGKLYRDGPLFEDD